jgi:hypothetical protein
LHGGGSVIWAVAPTCSSTLCTLQVFDMRRFDMRRVDIAKSQLYSMLSITSKRRVSSAARVPSFSRYPCVNYHSRTLYALLHLQPYIAKTYIHIIIPGSYTDLPPHCSLQPAYADTMQATLLIRPSASAQSAHTSCPTTWTDPPRSSSAPQPASHPACPLHPPAP